MIGHGSLIGFQWFDAIALLLVLIGGLALLVLKVVVFGAVSSALRTRRQPGEARAAANTTRVARVQPPPPPPDPAFDPDAEAEAFLADFLQALPTEEELANT